MRKWLYTALSRDVLYPCCTKTSEVSEPQDFPQPSGFRQYPKNTACLQYGFPYAGGALSRHGPSSASAVAHQHQAVKGWSASPASVLQPRPSERTMAHLPGGLPTTVPTHQTTSTYILFLLLHCSRPASIPSEYAKGQMCTFKHKDRGWVNK